MALANINREDLQSTLIQLEQAMHNHRQWYDSNIRTLVCGLKSDRRDISENPHQECLFGQWYYGTAPSPLKDHSGFKTIGEVHQHMHQIIKKILKENDEGRKINVLDFDKFANSIQGLQLEIRSLHRELELILYTHDPLTNAINRIDMMPALREIHETSKRNNSTPSSIVMVDLDHFKQINDTYGHAAGDKVLIAISHYLIDQMRPYDKIFRFGGEEFLICMQHTDLANCYSKCEELRNGLGKLSIDIGKKEPILITASFGISLLEPNMTVEESIENADKAMYSAKSSGRNCTVTWNKD